MKNKLYIPLTIIAVSLAAIITFQCTTLYHKNKYREQIVEISEENNSEFGSKLAEIEKIVNSVFLFDKDKEYAEESAVRAYLSALGDKYTYYMSTEEYALSAASNNDKAKGIGVTAVYNSENEAIEVVSVVSGTPAFENGILPGDLIYKIGDELVSELGYMPSIEKLRGEVGTVAEFSIMRNGNNIDFSITRVAYEDVDVTYRMYSDGHTGVVRISEFDTKTPEQFKKAVNELISNGADRFVFDVRSNPGGDLNAITEVLDFLLPEGPIIRTMDKNGQGFQIDSDENCIKYPFAVLTNGSTASAAELFTSALRDYKLANIVGEKTYGKGIMQTTMKLTDGSAVSVTTAYYLPPFSENYHGVGILPDVECKMDEQYASTSIYKLTDETDNMLKTAVEQFEK